jgi:hypothetical protein
MLTSEDVAEFKQLWQSEFSEMLSDGEAAMQANRLLKFYDLVLRKDVPAEQQSDVASSGAPVGPTVI